MNRILVNPAAGRGKSRQALSVLHQLAARGELDLRISRNAQDLVDQAEDAVQAGVERLVVAGGDGTFHHVAQALVGSTCALGVIPLGRGNDFASVLGVPAVVDEAFQFALEGPIRTIDVGRVNDRYFTGYFGVGFDSEAALYAHEAPAVLRGTLAYVYSVLRTLVAFRPPVLTVDHDEGNFKGPAMFAVVCNISRFGGGMRIAPAARFDDGELDLVIAKKLGRVEILRVFPKVYTGKHVDHPAVRMHRTRSARISVDQPVAVACDGEPLGRVAAAEGLEVSVEASSLRVVAPDVE